MDKYKRNELRRKANIAKRNNRNMRKHFDRLPDIATEQRLVADTRVMSYAKLRNMTSRLVEIPMMAGGAVRHNGEISQAKILSDIDTRVSKARDKHKFPYD